MSWWCIAWSEELKDKPLAVRVGDEELVLFRDTTGSAKVCEDRCAHRRVPLSLGWVTDKGSIQCAYHGWAYDGGSGQCVDIPNFRPGEPISPRVKIRVFPLVEVQGAIFVRLDSAAAEDCPPLPQLTNLNPADSLHGSVDLEIAHAEWVEGLIADPFSALGLDFEVIGERTQRDSGNASVLIQLQARPRGNSSASPLIARLEVWAQTGLTQLSVRDSSGAALLNVIVSGVPIDATHTRVRWKLDDSRNQNAIAAALRKLFGRRAAGLKIQREALAKIGAPTEQAALIWRNLQANGQSSAVRIRSIEES